MIAIKTRGQSRHQPPTRLPRNRLDVCCGWRAREAMRPGMEQRELRKDKTKHEANVRRFDGGKLFRGAVWVRSLPEHLRQPPKANAAVSMPGCTAVDARALPPRARGQLEAQRSVSCKSNREAVATITEIMRASTRHAPRSLHTCRAHTTANDRSETDRTYQPKGEEERGSALPTLVGTRGYRQSGGRGTSPTATPPRIVHTTALRPSS